MEETSSELLARGELCYLCGRDFTKERPRVKDKRFCKWCNGGIER